ncbi:hypothetical protein QEZ52_12255 [Aliisedimentitalea scapharcae]|uniref:Uncharacterized protein n=1 Tax=Aliisedimentitalea scapharcae TaxID=1524259 RepID=A0ABZ2XMV2_9RHOB
MGDEYGYETDGRISMGCSSDMPAVAGGDAGLGLCDLSFDVSRQEAQADPYHIMYPGFDPALVGTATRHAVGTGNGGNQTGMASQPVLAPARAGDVRPLDLY